MMYQEKIRAVLTREHKNKPTLIQERTYEAISNGASVVAYAKTGTGKTLAYSLPSIEKVIKGEANSVVIMAPTTELAVQIRHAINPYLKALDLKGVSLVGAGNRKRQEERLKKEHPEVVVATPGRFFDFFSSNRIKPEQIKTLIIDEADDVLEFKKMDLLTSLGQNLGPASQILLFGATESEITQNAEAEFNRHFLLIDVRKEQKSEVKHYFLQVDNRHKLDFVQSLVKLKNFKGILFFDTNQNLLHFAGILGHTKTKFALLTNDFGKQSRQESLRALATGKVRLLLATDLAARGLDIPNLTYVVNFDYPREANTYLHRAGRTGRLSKKGFVVTLGDDHDLRSLRQIVNLPIKRVYFGKNKLSLKMPKKASPIQKNETVSLKHKKKKKRKNKNKGYHPHYLKAKK